MFVVTDVTSAFYSHKKTVRPPAMDLNAAKGVSLVLLLVLTVVLGVLPVWLHHRGVLTSTGSRCRRLTLSFLNCFAGGVFLGTCLLHLLVEGREDMQRYLESVGVTDDFPYYETGVAVGLFLVALVEKLGFALMSFSRQRLTSDVHDIQETASIRKSPPSSFSVHYAHTAENRHQGYGATTNTNDTTSEVYHNHLLDDQNSKTTSKGQQQDDPSYHLEICKSADHQLPISHVANHRKSRSLTSSLERGTTDAHPRPHHHHHHSVATSGPCDSAAITQVSGLRALLLLLALSFHTIFDGLAVGLQESSTQVWQVLGAISIHKALVAFCLGLELSTASPGNWRRPVFFIFLFALMSPIGIGIGMGVTSSRVDASAELLTSSILQALATGTFLYVTFFEILGQQFAHDHQQQRGQCLEILKVLVTMVGFAAMAATKLLDSD